MRTRPLCRTWRSSSPPSSEHTRRRWSRCGLAWLFLPGGNLRERALPLLWAPSSTGAWGGGLAGGVGQLNGGQLLGADAGAGAGAAAAHAAAASMGIKPSVAGLCMGRVGRLRAVLRVTLAHDRG